MKIPGRDYKLSFIPLAPTLSWRIFYQLFSKKSLSASELARAWQKSEEAFFWFSRSAWSLAAISLLWQDLFQRKDPWVWIPDYFCDSSLEPLRNTGAEIFFYPVNDKLEPDFELCRSLSKNRQPNVFVLTHYFGYPSNAKKAAEFCHIKHAWLVEDAAHVLKPAKGIGDCGDFILYSPHKCLAIPDGAVLLMRSNGPGSFGDSDASISDLFKSTCQNVRKKECDSSASIGKWMAKRMLQGLGLPSVLRKMEFEKDDASVSVCDPSVSGMSLKLLSAQIHDLSLVSHKRLSRQKLWQFLLKDCENVRPLPTDGCGRFAPYMAPFKVSDGKLASTMFQGFRMAGLPSTTWPDLPLEVKGNPDCHRQAWDARYSTVCFPSHQSVKLKRITERFRPDFLRRESICEVSTQWDEIQEDDWNETQKFIAHSNMLQSWAYGHAKQVSEGWRCRNLVFKIQEKPVAISLVLERKMGHILRVFRINRGPLFLEELSFHERAAVFRKLGTLGNWLRRSILFIAPEIGHNGENLAMLTWLGYREWDHRPWLSARLELEESVQNIRSNLDGKWRNMLKSSEKSGVSLDISTDEPVFEWMVERYLELTRAKAFQGIGEAILRAYYHSCISGQKPIIMRAIYEGQPVALVCIAVHGRCATYLIGWNSEFGRTLKANHFLIWNAILWLKNHGYECFDLGGMDPENQPGITRFKSGLNGREYRLVGEFVKY